jgi:hypothetical protein
MWHLIGLNLCGKRLISTIQIDLKRVKQMMTKVAVLINDVEKQYEGLRSSLGMLLYNTEVQMFVINKEIANMDEAYQDNMEFLDEMEGQRFSNNKANVEKYGFTYASVEEMGEMLQQADLVIPY